MKPKNKFHKDIVKRSAKLRCLTKHQTEWAIKECIPHYAFRLKCGTATCMDCGHTWRMTESVKECVCPHCGLKLAVDDTRKRKFTEKMYFNVLDMHGRYQTLRMFAVFAEMTKGSEADYRFYEIGQYWVDEKGNWAVIGRRRTMGYYINSFSYHSPMELRCNDDAFSDIARNYPMYPKMKITRSLYVDVAGNRFFGLSPAKCISRFLSLPQLETLMKNDDERVFRYFLSHPYECRICWPSYKIAKRHRYAIKELGMWCDYIRMLKICKKDIRNPHFICPQNLRQEHDIYCKKVMEIEERKRREAEIRRKERNAIRQQQENENYIRSKSKFFGMVLSDGEIEVRVLESVGEFIEEGREQHICVGTSMYYTKRQSLILSARIGGIRIETVEVDLDTMEVVQCHGKYNKDTEYHDRIVNLVNSNSETIRKRMTA